MRAFSSSQLALGCFITILVSRWSAQQVWHTARAVGVGWGGGGGAVTAAAPDVPRAAEPARQRAVRTLPAVLRTEHMAAIVCVNVHWLLRCGQDGAGWQAGCGGGGGGSGGGRRTYTLGAQPQLHRA